MEKSVFFDKDGTLIKNVRYNIDPKHLCISENAVSGLRALQQAGFLFIVVTNQSGIARGYFKEHELLNAFHEMKRMFLKVALHLDAIYFCPHFPGGAIKDYAINCNCRKPSAGMIFKAASDHNIDLAKSWMVGDSISDMEAGNISGCKTILLSETKARGQMLSGIERPCYATGTINEAASYILDITDK